MGSGKSPFVACFAFLGFLFSLFSFSFSSIQKNIRSSCPNAVQHIHQAVELGLVEGDYTEMEFPAMGIQEAVEFFSERAYGKRISLEHA